METSMGVRAKITQFHYIVDQIINDPLTYKNMHADSLINLYTMSWMHESVIQYLSYAQANTSNHSVEPSEKAYVIQLTYDYKSKQYLFYVDFNPRFYDCENFTTMLTLAKVIPVSNLPTTITDFILFDEQNLTNWAKLRNFLYDGIDFLVKHDVVNRLKNLNNFLTNLKNTKNYLCFVVPVVKSKPLEVQRNITNNGANFTLDLQSFNSNLFHTMYMNHSNQLLIENSNLCESSIDFGVCLLNTINGSYSFVKLALDRWILNNMQLKDINDFLAWAQKEMFNDIGFGQDKKYIPSAFYTTNVVIPNLPLTSTFTLYMILSILKRQDLQELTNFKFDFDTAKHLFYQSFTGLWPDEVNKEILEKLNVIELADAQEVLTLHVNQADRDLIIEDSILKTLVYFMNTCLYFYLFYIKLEQAQARVTFDIQLDKTIISQFNEEFAKVYHQYFNEWIKTIEWNNEQVQKWENRLNNDFTYEEPNEITRKKIDDKKRWN